jgi:hypothetical protein
MSRHSVLKSSTALEGAVLVLEGYQDYLRAQADAAAQRERTGQAPQGLSPAPARAPPQVWLRTPEAAAHLGLSVSTLTKWRMQTNKGPPFAKAGASVRYSLRDLDAWVSARRITSTSAMAAPAVSAPVSDARRRATTQP